MEFYAINPLHKQRYKKDLWKQITQEKNVGEGD